MLTFENIIALGGKPWTVVKDPCGRVVESHPALNGMDKDLERSIRFALGRMKSFTEMIRVEPHPALREIWVVPAAKDWTDRCGWRVTHFMKIEVPCDGANEILETLEAEKYAPKPDPKKVRVFAF